MVISVLDLRPAPRAQGPGERRRVRIVDALDLVDARRQDWSDVEIATIQHALTRGEAVRAYVEKFGTARSARAIRERWRQGRPGR